MPNNDDIAIRVEGLGKKYLVPQKHLEDHSEAPSMGRRMKEFFPGMLGAEESDFFWALRDVSFEVKRGEVFGIVGENGSGKSTLLKILSGVTPPTEGKAELRGRVGSLLEVGTGFHPDLTGRENIYFNGSLLGIKTADIHDRIANIIEFSGIGEFIDVPVKRYSSGMYVRLAYSVASLLQSDIMILDEVLSVGDSSFRTKSEQNIRSTAASGRTILLVSHNPRSIATICNRAIILYKGKIVFAGNAKDVMAEYLSDAYKPPEAAFEDEPEQESETVQDGSAEKPDAAAKPEGDVKSEEPKPEGEEAPAVVVAPPPQTRTFIDISRARRFRDPSLPPPTYILKWVSIHDLDGNLRAEFGTGEGVRVRIGYSGLKNPEQTYFCLFLYNSAHDRMATIYSTDAGKHVGTVSDGVMECVLPSLPFGLGLYSLEVDIGVYDHETMDYGSRESVPFVTFIRIKDKGFLKGLPHSEFQGAVLRSEWSVVDVPVPAGDATNSG